MARQLNAGEVNEINFADTPKVTPELSIITAEEAVVSDAKDMGENEVHV